MPEELVHLEETRRVASFGDDGRACVTIDGIRRDGTRLKVFSHPTEADVKRLRKCLVELHGRRILHACLYCGCSEGIDRVHDVLDGGDFYRTHDKCIAKHKRQQKAAAEAAEAERQASVERHRAAVRRGRRWFRVVCLLRWIGSRL